MTIHTSLEIVTPEMAQELLSKNTINRSVRMRHVRAIADDILNGRWDWNGASIVVNGDGTLLDGQHRLLAIVEADTPVKTMIVRGLSKSVIPTIDGNISRKAADVLSMSGVPYAKRTEAAVRLLIGAEKGHATGAEKKSNSLIVDYITSRPALVDAIRDCDAASKIIPQSVVGAWRYMAMKSTLTERANAALYVIVSGIPDYPGDPIHAFRERVIKMPPAEKSTAADRMTLYYTLVGCWNDFVAHKKISRVQLKTKPVEPIGATYDAP